MSNGRAWLALPSSEVKALYLSGVRDAIKNTDCQPGNPLLLPNVTPAQLVPYFDEIYAKPENARIPILYMMPVVKRRLEGQSLSDVETEVSMWRKMSAKQ